ncbi:MAG: PLP-dependent transferase [Nocardioides sp.]
MAGTDTTAVHAAREDLVALGVHVPSIDLSTTYPMPDIESGGAAYDLMGGGHRPHPDTPLVYQRLWNPNVDRFERGVAALEGCEEGVAFATGMAATTAVLLACVAAGTPHIVALRPVYGGTDSLLDSGLLGTRVSWVTPDQVADAVTPETGLVIAETPGNPTLELIDIEALAAAAGDVPVLIDNTFATPVLQRPARHGAMLVLHSATKYLGGHGDLMGGVVCGPPEWTARIRPVRALTGALLHPLAAYQLHRGLQTLPVRVRAQQETARVVADWLAEQPQVARVYYPGQPGDPLGLVGTQMAGPGAIVAADLTGGTPRRAGWSDTSG